MSTSPTSTTATTTIMVTFDVPVTGEPPMSWQQFLNFRPLPQWHGSFLPRVLDIDGSLQGVRGNGYDYGDRYEYKVRSPRVTTSPVELHHQSNLTQAGLITRSERGQQVYFEADRNAPVFEEVRCLLEGTIGLAAPLRAALATIERRGDVALAFVYGSVALGQHRPMFCTAGIASSCVTFALTLVGHEDISIYDGSLPKSRPGDRGV